MYHLQPGATCNKTTPMCSLVIIYIIHIHRNQALKYSEFFVCKIKRNRYEQEVKYTPFFQKY